jgi:hypothetical protein
MTITHSFPVGAKVIFTNDYGVCFGVKTVTGHAERSGKPTYHYTPTDTPWFPTDEANLTLADAQDLIVDRVGVLSRALALGEDGHVRPVTSREAFFQAKYGRPTTKEELAALLDGDPFDGEE